MALLNPPSSTAVVDVPDALVAAYVAQGWTTGPVAADKSEATPEKPRATRQRK